MARARLEALREEMKDKGLEALLVSEPHYAAALFDGAQTFNGTRQEPAGRLGIVVTADGLLCLGNDTEVARFATEELADYTNVDKECYPWHSWNLERAAKGALSERGLKSWWADCFGADRKACRELLDAQLYPLEADEIERLHLLGRLTASILEQTVAELKIGVSELEISSRIHARLLAKGALPDLIFVGFDDRIAEYRHCKPGSSQLEHSALLSITAGYRGLYVSATRLAALKPAPELAEQTRRACAIETAALEAVVEGKRLEEIFAAIRDEYAAQGEPAGWRRHHLGGPSGFKGRDAKIGPDSSGPPLSPGRPFVFNPVYLAGKSEDTFIIDPDSGKLVCLTEDSVWPRYSINTSGGFSISRPGVYCPDNLQVGLVGLGRMGSGVADQLTGTGADLFGCDPNVSNRDYPVTDNLRTLCEQLTPPRLILLMVPSSEVESVLLGDNGLVKLCRAGDVIVDCGNCNHHDSVRRGRAVLDAGIGYLDAGVSGGLEGAADGMCIACGGQEVHFNLARKALERIVRPGCLTHTGPLGTGHFLKTVHNGIEYGMMQAIAEGLATIEHNANGYPVTAQLGTAVWRRGSIIESRLFDWFGEATELGVTGIQPSIGGGETGRWAAREAVAAGIDAPALEAALDVRSNPRQGRQTIARLLARVRQVFGGHAIKTGDR
ncbi:MAG: M24 family metallopeptidase [bacterium]|nr:M24 family metallopeptidase [bacterium]